MILEAKQHIVLRKSGRNLQPPCYCPSIENARIISDDTVYTPAGQLVSNVKTIHLYDTNGIVSHAERTSHLTVQGIMDKPTS